MFIFYPFIETISSDANDAKNIRHGKITGGIHSTKDEYESSQLLTPSISVSPVTLVTKLNLDSKSDPEFKTVTPTLSGDLDTYLKYIESIIVKMQPDLLPPKDYDPDKELEGLPTLGGISYMDKINKWFEEQSKM